MKTVTRLTAALIVLLFCSPIVTVAQIGSPPEALFGAQGLSLGRSAILSPHDALAVSWNPAGITALQRVTVSVASGSLLTDDASHTSVGFVIPTRRFGHFGVSFFQIMLGILARDADNVGFSESYFNHKTKFHGGVEYSHSSTIALRAGLYDSQFSAGVGLQFKGLIIDYARNNWQIESDGWSSSTDALTLTYQF